jgi:nicotinamidase-related amidase
MQKAELLAGRMCLGYTRFCKRSVIQMKRLLVVVDFQNDFVDGALGFPSAGSLEKSICEKIEEYRRNGDDVVYTLDTHDSNYLRSQEGRKLPVEHCVTGTRGHELYGRTAKLLAGAKTFRKSAFGSDLLYEYLKRSEYGSVELVGLVSNICILSNAVLAKTALPEAEIIVDPKCTASFDEELNQKTLDVLEGIQVAVRR